MINKIYYEAFSSVMTSLASKRAAKVVIYCKRHADKWAPSLPAQYIDWYFAFFFLSAFYFSASLSFLSFFLLSSPDSSAFLRSIDSLRITPRDFPNSFPFPV